MNAIENAGTLRGERITMRSRQETGFRNAAAALAALAVLGVACNGKDRAQPAGGAKATSRTSHALSSGAQCSGTDVHQKHIGLFACVTCHPSGAAFGFDAPYAFPSGKTSTNGGTLTRGANGVPTSCTVACHFPLGAPPHPVSWDAPAPLACASCHATTALPPAHPAVNASATSGDCQGCHVSAGHMDGSVTLVSHAASWMDQASPGFHAYTANAGLGSCQQCHGQDLAGGGTGVACARCHDKTLNGTVVAWKTNCTMCHGGTDNQTGAPPAATWGHAGDANRGGGAADPVRVGAHGSHLAASAIAPPFDCGVCHVKPADALSGGHVDGATATVAFAGVAAQNVTPSWDRTPARCTNVYCHGATLAGGTNTAPVWTSVGQGQADCGTCHGLPPPPPHPDVASGLTACSACHSLTIDATGVLIPPSAGGKHLDGLVEATGGHPASWMAAASAGFHAFSANQGIANCTSCHAADLSGGTTGVACAQCHKPGGTANDFGTCTACHGGVANQTGAPPAATWGYAGDVARGGGTMDPIRVGAHTKHVEATIATPYDCGVCHVKPTGPLSTGHIDHPTALVTWGGVATAGGAQPSWNRVGGTCASTYCHGNYAGVYAYETYDWGTDTYTTMYVNYAGKKAAPGWLDGPMTCGSCHGNPPAGTGVWHSGSHGYDASDRQCQLCHPDATSVGGVGAAVTNPAQHLNGIVEVTPAWQTNCFGCH